MLVSSLVLLPALAAPWLLVSSPSPLPAVSLRARPWARSSFTRGTTPRTTPERAPTCGARFRSTAASHSPSSWAFISTRSKRPTFTTVTTRLLRTEASCPRQPSTSTTTFARSLSPGTTRTRARTTLSSSTPRPTATWGCKGVLFTIQCHAQSIEGIRRHFCALDCRYYSMLDPAHQPQVPGPPLKPRSPPVISGVIQEPS